MGSRSRRGRSTGSLLLLSLHLLCLHSSLRCSVSAAGSGDPYVGVTIGTAVTNLLSPSDLAAFLRAERITHVRLYDADPRLLSALASSGASAIVGVPNDELLALGSSPATASAWVAKRVVPFAAANSRSPGLISAIAVGDEVPTALPSALPVRAPGPPPGHPVPRCRARRSQPLVHPRLHPAPVLHRPRPLPPFPGLLQPVPGEILPPAAPLPPRQHLRAAHAQPLPLLLADAEQRRRPGRQRHVQAAPPVAGDGRPQHAAPLHQRVRRHARRRVRRLEEPQRDRQRAGAGHRDRLALLRGPQGGAVRQQGQRQHLQLQLDQARRHGQARHADAARHAGQRVHLRALQRGPPAGARVGGQLGALPRQRHAGVPAPRQRVRRFLGERHHGPDLLHRVGRRGREGGAGGHGLGVRPWAVRLHGDTARGRLLPAQRRAEPRVVRIQHLLPVAGQGRRLLLLPGRRHGHHHGSQS